MSAEFLTSDGLSAIAGINHAFFTRRGGVSGGIYKGLNVGAGSQDHTAAIIENRTRCMTALGSKLENLVHVYQVHGVDVAVVDGPWDKADIPKADAMVSNKADTVLGILTADCTPILFADPIAGVIGAAHAGWKGALGGVGDATVVAMEKLGAKRANITAAVGPCIAQSSYEVGPEFPLPFLMQNTENKYFFQNSRKRNHHMFDIGGYNLHRLKLLGLANVEWVKRDTCAEEDMFFSYRRATKRGEPDFGRLLSAIQLKG